MVTSAVLRPSTHTPDSTQPRKVWWLIGALLLAFCILAQMPASWLVQKFLPNSASIQYVSGNLWQGSAIVQLPELTKNERQNNTMPLSTNVVWQWRPLGVLTGKLSAKVDITSGNTHLDGVVSRGFGTWGLSDLSGRIDKQALMSIVDWQLPDAPIQVNTLSMVFDEETGFEQVDGQLTWVGGELGYPSGNKTFNLTLPSMRADIAQETKGNSQVVHINLVDSKSKRLGDIYLDAEGMLDVSLTQRLLENMPEYKGNAPADTAVVSVRQPLFSGMSLNNTRNTMSDSANIDQTISPQESN